MYKCLETYHVNLVNIGFNLMLIIKARHSMWYVFDQKCQKRVMPHYNSFACLLSTNMTMSRQVATFSPCTCKLGHAMVRTSDLQTISPMYRRGEYMDIFSSSLFFQAYFIYSHKIHSTHKTQLNFFIISGITDQQLFNYKFSTVCVPHISNDRGLLIC